MLKKISLILGFLMILLVGSVFSAPPTNPLEFNEGLILTLNNIDEHIINTDLALYSGIYDTKTGIKQDNTTICSADVLFMKKDNIEIVFNQLDFNYEQNILVLNASIFNRTGKYIAEFWCEDSTNTKGGYTSQTFFVYETTKFGIWKPVENWTFPIVYLILTFIIIALGLYYESSIVGIFGSIMLVFAYFLIGATSPLLFAPLLILGLLFGFRFATI